MKFDETDAPTGYLQNQTTSKFPDANIFNPDMHSMDKWRAWENPIVAHYSEEIVPLERLYQGPGLHAENSIHSILAKLCLPELFHQQSILHRRNKYYNVEDVNCILRTILCATAMYSWVIIWMDQSQDNIL